MTRLRVIRGEPKDRSTIKDLTGSLIFEIEVLDPVHVGGASYSLEGADRIINMRGFEGSVEDKVRKLKLLALKELVGKEAPHFFSLRGRPSIPGSSLKGAVRSRLELSFRGYHGEVPSCFSVTGGRPFKAEKGGRGWRHQLIYPSSLEDRGYPCNYTKYGTVCKVCDIFGAPGLSSRVHFPSIEFDCDTYFFDASYTGPVEVLPIGCKAQGEMTFLNMEPYELGLVLIGMGDMKPILLGFGKYREHKGGKMGRIKLTPVEWRFLPPSGDILRELGISFEEGALLRVRPAERLWGLLTSSARKRYSNYLGEVRVTA